MEINKYYVEKLICAKYKAVLLKVRPKLNTIDLLC